MKILRVLRNVTTTLLILCPANQAFADSRFHSLDDIVEVAHTHIHQVLENEYSEYNVKIRPLDNRLKLTACDTPLTAFSPVGARTYGATTVGIKCAGPKPWSLYVSMRIEAFEQVITFVQPLPARTKITAAHLKLKRTDISTLHAGAYHSTDQLVGYETRYAVRAGEVVSSNKVQLPKLVESGESVDIISTYQGIEVRAAGTALSDGAKGDRIRVRNHSSRRVIEAYIEGTNRVVTR